MSHLSDDFDFDRDPLTEESPPPDGVPADIWRMIIAPVDRVTTAIGFWEDDATSDLVLVCAFPPPQVISLSRGDVEFSHDPDRHAAILRLIGAPSDDDPPMAPDLDPEASISLELPRPILSLSFPLAQPSHVRILRRLSEQEHVLASWIDAAEGRLVAQRSMGLVPAWPTLRGLVERATITP